MFAYLLVYVYLFNYSKQKMLKNIFLTEARIENLHFSPLVIKYKLYCFLMLFGQLERFICLRFFIRQQKNVQQVQEAAQFRRVVQDLLRSWSSALYSSRSLSRHALHHYLIGIFNKCAQFIDRYMFFFKLSNLRNPSGVG